MSKIRAIRTEADYKAAVARVDALMDADFGTQENQKGDAVVQQVAAFWKSLGLVFPVEGVLERN